MNIPKMAILWVSWRRCIGFERYIHNVYIIFAHTHTHFSSSDNFRKPRLRHIELGLAHRLLTRPFVLALKSAILKSWLVGGWAHPQPTRWIQMMQLAVPKANHTQKQWRNVLNRPSQKYKVYGSLTKWTYDLSWWVLFDASIMQSLSWKSSSCCGLASSSGSSSGSPDSPSLGYLLRSLHILYHLIGMEIAPTKSTKSGVNHILGPWDCKCWSFFQSKLSLWRYKFTQYVH